jgi:hypothetical protein
LAWIALAYFSRGALTALEWGHPLGLPSLLAKALVGRWLLVPTAWNVALTGALLRCYYAEPLPEEGAYLFFVARKAGEGMSVAEASWLSGKWSFCHFAVKFPLQ